MNDRERGVRTMKRQLIAIHRWLGLGFALFWLLQAVSGVILVFHWELDDWFLPGEARAMDAAALDRRVARLQADYPEATVTSIWVSGGTAGRYDIYLDQPGEGPEIVRVAGDGAVLRARETGQMVANGGFYDTLVRFHQSLLAGSTGEWLIGISGILLLSNLVLGLKLAWAAKGQWKLALSPPSRGGAVARLRGWHRALGLWLAPLALVLVSCGVALVFYEGLENVLDMEAPAPKGSAVQRGEPVSPGEAITVATGQFAGSVFSGMNFPAPTQPYYTVRVLHPDEWRRVYGKSAVLVAATGGEILARYDATRAPIGQRLLENAFALHTGEAGGIVGRIAVLVLGCWLAAMVILGVAMWLRRRSRGSRTTY